MLLRKASLPDVVEEDEEVDDLRQISNLHLFSSALNNCQSIVEILRTTQKHTSSDFLQI
jgi:hypothetical protein